MDPTPLEPRLLARAHLRALVDAVAHAEDALRQPAVLQEASALLGKPLRDALALDAELEERRARPEFLAWLLWDHCPGRDAPLGVSLLATTTDARQKKVLQALLATPPQCWEICSNEGAGIVGLRALGERRKLLLREPILAAAAQPGDLWIGRVIGIEGVALLDAVHLWLPRGARPAMLREAKRIRSLPRAEQLAAWLAAGSLAAVRRHRRDRRAQLHLHAHYLTIDEASWLAAAQRLVARGELEPTPGGWSVLTPAALAGVQLHWQGGRLCARLWQPRRAPRLLQWLEEQLPEARLLVTVQTDARSLLSPDPAAPWTAESLRPLAESWLATQALLANAPLAADEPRPHDWWMQVQRVSRWAGKDWQARVASWSVDRQGS